MSKKLENMKYNELRRLAKERNINLGRNPKKEVLIEALKEDKMSEKKERRNSAIRRAVYALLVLVLAAVVIYLVVDRRQLKNQTQEALALNQKAVEQNAKLNDQNTELLEELDRQQANIGSTDEKPADTATEEPAETEEPKDTECKVLTTADVKELTGVDVQRVNTEPATWTWRAVDLASTPATCPVGFVCTVDLGGKVLVYEGRANTGIVAGTFRHVCQFDPGDAVYTPCTLLRKEQEFGASEVPSFDVTAGNFSCP